MLLLASACSGLIEEPGLTPPVCGSNCPEDPKPEDPRPEDPDPSDPACTSTKSYFRDHSWPEVFNRCVACHVAGGQANGTKFVLKPASVPNYLETNMQIVTEVAELNDPASS